MLVAFIVAVIVGLIVKIGLSQFSQTAPYADVIALIVGVLVFLAKSGLVVL